MKCAYETCTRSLLKWLARVVFCRLQAAESGNSVGLQELGLIDDSGMQAFPARLPPQPILFGNGL